MVYMRRKPAFIMLTILGIICLVDGSKKKDVKELLVGAASTTYAVVTLASDYKKKKEALQQKKPL